MPTPRRRRLLAALVGLGLLAALDLLLQPLAPRIAPPPVFHPVAIEGALFTELPGGHVRAQFQAKYAVPPFPTTPPAGVTRVMVFGESSVRGGSDGIGFQDEFPARLWRALSAQGQRCEVLNLGKPGIDSPQIVEVARAALAYAPDVAVVYTGHNDVGNMYMGDTYGGAGALAVEHLRAGLERLATYRLVRRGVVAVRPELYGAVRPAWRLDETRLTRAVEGFRANLTAMVRAWKAAGVEVVLATPTSNLRAWDNGLPSCPELLPGGWRQGEDGRWRLARAVAPAVVDDALVRFPECAEAHWLRGMAALDAGDDAAAATSLRRARDLDPLSLRAPEVLLDTIRAVAAAEGVPLADLDRSLDPVAPPRELFVDVLHLSPAGHDAVAQALTGPVGDAVRRAGAR